MSQPSRPGALLNGRQVASVRDDVMSRLRAHPEWPDLWNMRGLLDAHEGDLSRAQSSFTEATRRNRNYAAARANRAWIETLTGQGGVTAAKGIDEDARGAIGFVRNLVAGVEPCSDWMGNRPSLAFLAMLHAAAKAAPSELNALRGRLGRLVPGAERLLEAAGLIDDGHLTTCTLRTLSHPERLNPGFTALLLRSARLEGVAGRDDEATRLHAMAGLYRGDLALFLVEQGEAASRRGKSDQALRLLRDAVEAGPDWHRSHQALGYELSLRGIVGESLHHLAQATRLEPRFADILYQHGLLLHAAGLNAEAMDVMGRALSANPRYLVARIALANLLFEADRAGEAVPHYEHVLDEGIETPALAGQFGYALHAAGNRNRAEELFLEAIARHRNRPELLAHYGQFLRETDRHLEAQAVWERALESDPSPKLRLELQTLLGEIPMDRRGKAHE